MNDIIKPEKVNIIDGGRWRKFVRVNIDGPDKVSALGFVKDSNVLYAAQVARFLGVTYAAYKSECIRDEEWGALMASELESNREMEAADAHTSIRNAAVNGVRTEVTNPEGQVKTTVKESVAAKQTWATAMNADYKPKSAQDINVHIRKTGVLQIRNDPKTISEEDWAADGAVVIESEPAEQ